MNMEKEIQLLNSGKRLNNFQLAYGAIKAGIPLSSPFYNESNSIGSLAKRVELGSITTGQAIELAKSGT